MRLTLLAALALIAASVPAEAKSKAQPEPEAFRKLEWQVVSPWEVAWIGNDKKVNHCMLQRGELLMADPKPGAPSFVIVADREHTILRVRATDYRFTGKRMLAVTLVTADGAVRTPLGAAATGPDLVDMELGKDRALLDRLAQSGHVEVRLKGGTVRLPLDRLSEALAPYDRCMADIGKPAKGFSDAEIDALARQIAKGRAKCSENKRTRVVTCEVD